MNFWKEHANLRVVIMAAFFVIGLTLVVCGWKMTGRPAGLGMMLVGLVLLLAALMVYNKPFEDRKR